MRHLRSARFAVACLVFAATPAGPFAQESAPPLAPAPAATHPSARTTVPQPLPAITDLGDRNDFQDFVAQSTGKNLPLYGAGLFAGVVGLKALRDF